MHVIHVMHDVCNACTATLLLNYLRRSDIRHGCCSKPLPDKSGMEAALQFLAAFPDASSWHVTILSPDKRCIINKPAVGTDEFRQALPAWLQLHDVHFFVRPLLSRLIFLDLDKFAGRWTELVELQPRVITETSPGNYQWWATLSESLPLKNAGIATKQLQVVFGSDPHSTGPQQQGRLPGSLNAKVGKQCSVRVLHQCVTAHFPMKFCCASRPRLSCGWTAGPSRPQRGHLSCHPLLLALTEVERIGNLHVNTSKRTLAPALKRPVPSSEDGRLS